MASGFQYRSIVADVVQQDISIDIGKNIVEHTAMWKEFCSALFYPYIERIVEPAVLNRHLHGEAACDRELMGI